LLSGLALAYAALWVGLRWLCMRTKSQWCCGERRLGGRKVSALLWPWNRWRGTGAVPVLVHASWHQSSEPRWAISRKRGGGT